MHNCGYVGGIGPHNITEVLEALRTHVDGGTIWVDMESSLRGKAGEKDVFSMELAKQCAESVTGTGFPGDGGEGAAGGDTGAKLRWECSAA